jgi:sterol desaturase/sphingolipid hydroxylase (fatty acid hydroxylase superfamily)
MRVITTSRVNYVLSYALDLACPLVLAFLGLQCATLGITPIASLIVGAFVFTFIEYGTHRWFFHERGKFAATVHRAHHERPAEATALPCFSSPTAALGGSWLLIPLVGAEVTYFLLCGLLAGYFYYSLLHHLQHSVRASSISLGWLQRRWITHAAHHARPNANFGVTTSFWDHVFGTHYLPRRRRAFSNASAASRVSLESAP